jgi:Tol biopolymer transport system component
MSRSARRGTLGLLAVALLIALSLCLLRAPLARAYGTPAPVSREGMLPARASLLSSPDRIAFVWARGRSHIWSVAADGSHLRQLTRGDRNDHAPAWSPDRSTIAFVRGNAGKAGRTSLWLMKSNGADVRRVRYTGPSVTDAAGDLAWSPDGRYVAGAGLADEYQCAVTVLDLQTRTSQVVYTAPKGYWITDSVDWSPDSRYLVACVRTADPGPTVIVDMTGATAIREMDFGTDAWAYTVSWRAGGTCLQFFLWGLPDPATVNELWTFDGEYLGTLRAAMDFSYSPAGAEYCYVAGSRNNVTLRCSLADGSGPKKVLSIGKWSMRNTLEDLAWK